MKTTVITRPSTGARSRIVIPHDEIVKTATSGKAVRFSLDGQKPSSVRAAVSARMGALGLRGHMMVTGNTATAWAEKRKGPFVRSTP